MQVRPAFDVCAELPTGTTVLEASAGTGKTYTIAALVTRYVAEGLAELSELMVVTFSRAATQELRERVRERLVQTEHGLADPAGARRDSADPLLRLLAAGPDELVRVRRARLARALAGFDAATIATTHGFCQQMMAGLGIAGDSEPDATLVERIDDLTTEVVEDLYLRKFTPSGTAAPAITFDCARSVAQAAMTDRQAELVPADAVVGSPAQLRYGLASAVRREVEARKRARRLLDFDDVLTRLRDVLADPVRGPAAGARLRSRYRVVLVDEFQDTDPVQWQIVASAFAGTTTLVLIGDPKQAIYAFRGADLVTYLSAVGAATTHWTLAQNWRTDGDLVGAIDAVFAGAAMGDPDIVVRPGGAGLADRRLAAAGAPLRLRMASWAQAGSEDGKLPRVAGARKLVARDLAADVVALLTGPATLTLDDAARPVRPGDLAVLVRTNDQATLVREQLAALGVPAVATGSTSVFLSPMAREWLTLLRALEAPHRAGLVRSAALTCFLGWPADRLATTEDTATDELGRRLRRWRDVLTNRGVAALLEVITTSERLTERLLATPTGERTLTDLRQIGQILHATAVAGQLGPTALVEWLQRRITEAAGDSAEERSRRLETDAAAVQVVTIHGSKGLEFPIVYVPFGWDRNVPTSPDPLRLHTPEGTRQLDVGGPSGPAYRQRLVTHQAEEAGEDLRLLYVALTRAQCQVITWWVPSTTTAPSALHRLLFGEFAPGEQPARMVAVPADAVASSRLEARASAAAGALAVERIADISAAAWSPTSPPPAALATARFDRRLDGAWRRTSYSGLTAGLHDGTAPVPGVGSEPEVGEREDEPAGTPAESVGAAVGPQEERLLAIASPMAELPAGAAFGTLVHGVLEEVDTTAPDLAAELGNRAAEAVAARLASGVDAGALAAGLLPALETPLGPLAAHRRLRDFAPADRLAELDFELPLAGGSEPHRADATLAALAGLLRHRLAAADPLVGYADALEVPVLAEQRLRGYLAGSIDAVLRLRDDTGQARYLVVDYKTNWLGGFGPTGAEPLSAWHYRPAALRAEMLRAHYPLQALLYLVALHRFLRWRQPGYDPTRHLGGVLYLFLRGMCGPQTPVVAGMPCGIFSWLPPNGLVEELSSLLDRGAT